MLAPSRSKVLEKAILSNAVTLPSFLVPAFQASPRRQFSSTSSTPSKLGRTPISIPPGVDITVGEPRAKKDPTSYLRIAKRTVTVSGPLGKLDLEIPPFLTIHHDETARKALLSIENQELKQQKEMWGTYGRR
jgi:large subunit ribosomal protein L6